MDTWEEAVEKDDGKKDRLETAKTKTSNWHLQEWVLVQGETRVHCKHDGGFRMLIQKKSKEREQESLRKPKAACFKERKQRKGKEKKEKENIRQSKSGCLHQGAIWSPDWKRRSPPVQIETKRKPKVVSGKLAPDQGTQGRIGRRPAQQTQNISSSLERSKSKHQSTRDKYDP
eukprot:1161895-Pelagomonas_calceolata.AAC.2